MKNIKDIVNDLSREEQKKLSELIEECSQREIAVTSIKKNTRKAINDLGVISLSISNSLDKVDKANQELERQKNILKQQINDYRLRAIPDDAFFNA